MDVRYFNFLVRQPSARLVDRHTFWGMPKRGIALLLVNALFWQPFWAQAQGIAVSGGTNTTLGQAGNGVPIVNIAAPNASGLSHNQYQQYNVGAEGVILNNATGRTQSTQLGGIIVGNPNLNGNAAGTILNEVTGANVTQLQGYTEVAGQAARVIVANPYGISCNGCGFINTPRATLTTGKPVLGANGQLDHLQVDGGNVSIDGKGLDASTVDQFEIITRAAQINAQINAKQLAIVAGRNDVDAQTLNATARADDGSAKPSVAIDSSALGGMYAGAIKLVGTEAGVGVRLAGDLAASAGDIQIDANGQLNIAQVAASGGVNVKAASLESSGPVYAGTSLTASTRGDMNLQGNTAARDSITLNSSGQLTNGGIVEAGVNADNSRNSNGDIALNGRDVRNSGAVIASRGLIASAGQSLDNANGQLRAGDALNIDVGGGLNNQSGRIVAQTGLHAKAAQLNNSNGGKLLSGQAMVLDIATVQNQNNGVISAGTSLRLNGATLNNTNASVSAQSDLSVTLSGDLDNSQGLLGSEGSFSVAAENLINTLGQLSSAGALKVNAKGMVNNQKGSISTDSGLTLFSSSLDNHNQGTISAKGATQVNTGAFDNSQGGRLTSIDRLDLTAAQVINNDQGRIAAAKALTASVTGLQQRGGELFSNDTLSLDLNHGQLDNQGSLITASSGLLLRNLAGVDNRNGEISSASAFDLNATTLDNSGGKLLSQQALSVRVAQALTNVEGTITAAALDTKSASLDNTNGELGSGGKLTVDVDTSLINRNAMLTAAGELSLNAASVDNSHAGLIGANGALRLHADSIDNRGGEISSEADINVFGLQLNNSDAGRLIAQNRLVLSLDRTINRNAGVISGKTGLVVTGDQLDNSAASLLSQQMIDVRLSGGLLNNLGLINSEGTLDVRATALGNQSGSLSSAGALTLNSTGAITNQGGSLVTDGNLLLNSASLDNTDQGVVSAKGTVLIDTGDFDNSRNGRISSADQLEVHAAQLINRDGGSIGADKTLLASVSGLDQRGGMLFSNGGMVLDLNHGQLDNQGGLINATGTLRVANLANVNNQNGEISSASAFEFSADSFDNSNGKLLSNQALSVRVAQALANVKGMIAAASVKADAGSLDNSAGTFSSRGDLTLNVGGVLSNQSTGLISAAQVLKVRATSLNNTGGTLLGATALNLDFNGGDLNNRSGLITTQGALTLDHLRDLENANGEISSSQSFSLSGRAIDNSSGRLLSNQTLTLGADSLVNGSGLASGWQGLNISGGSLDNRDSGTLSSRNGDVDINLAGALLNGNSGAVVGQKALRIDAASIDNQGGILSSGAGQTLTVAGLLNNGQNGLIDSGEALVLNAANLDNATGTVNAQRDLSLVTTDLNNTAGTLVGNRGVNLDLLGKLINRNGKLASGGDLLIKRATLVDNQGGQMASQKALTLFTGSLDNSNRGTVAANDALVINASGDVQNANDGLIYSKGANLGLQAANLSNAIGTIQSKSGLDLTVTGDIDSQSGKILAQAGALNVSANNVDNRGGVLSSLQQAFTARITGVLKNGYNLDGKGGTTQAQSLDIHALAGIDNDGGRVSAQSGDALIDTGNGNFDNRNGGLYAKRRVGVTGNNFDNSGDNDGQIAGQQIDLSLAGALNNRLGIIESDTTLSIVAASLDNLTGQLRALGTNGTTSLTVTGWLNNTNGALESANTNLSLDVGALQNAGGSILHSGTGTFGVGLDLLQNTGGNVVSNGALTVSGASWSNTSVLQIGDLTVNVGTFNQSASGQLLTNRTFTGRGGNWNNDGLIASNGSADVQISGTYSGAGSLTSVGDLMITAGEANLGAATSRLSGGGKGVLSFAGTLRNLGRITTGEDLNVDAGAITNYGTLGGGQNVTLGTPALINENGLIFAGGNLALHANTFTNHTADVYGFGDVSISGYNGVTRSASVSNVSGAMESVGAFGIDADMFENRTEGGTGTGDRTLTSGFMAVRCNDCKGDYYDFTIVARETFEGADADTSAASTLSVGKDFVYHGGSFLNSKSTVSAGGNITIEADSLQNVGSVGGSIERTRTFATGNITDGTADRLMANVVLPYNQRNNPDFPLVYYIDDAGAISTATAKSTGHRVGGREGEFVWGVGLTDSVTGKAVRSAMTDDVYGLAESGLSYGFETKTFSQYDRNNLLALPGAITQYTLVSDVEVATDSTGAASTGTVRNAVIQAGGKVAITASQNLSNSVIHEDYGYSAGANQVQDTQTAAGGRVVVRVNAQLPPDLAQQQLNPLALPGFSLPTGQNGLFRLSGQGSSQPGAVATDWTLAGATLSTANREQSVASTQPRDILISSAGGAAPGAQQLAVGDRPVTNIAANGTDALTGTGLGQNVPRVQALPSAAAKPGSGKYLIETNPVLTDLKQFMSSDYLLSGVGYDPDQSAKRLGDGLYEQRLVQQAITARTGQAFIDGQTSNEAQFKYLMNNAIASKEALNLTVGVSLTSEQVAALTHDIVWLEEQEVNGEQVLVPVVYLAQASGRLGPTGALIAGNDVTLIAGNNLDNVGTLKATNNLAATAAGDMVNSSVIDAGNRLDLLAGNTITNKAGGIIAGRDVSATAVSGDVINERSNVALDSTTRGQLHKDYADSAARIEAANDLSVSAGRDISNLGSVLQTGRDLTLSAGRDVNIASTEVANSLYLNSKHNSSDITQLGSTVTAGRDLSVQAGRDLSIIASQLEAKRDIALAATQDLTISSAADEEHSLSKSKKVTRQEDHVSQVASTVTAGGSLAASAGQDMTITSSRLAANDEAYLVAGGKLDLLAAQDSDYSLYDKKKKGHFGAKKTKRDEVTQVTNIGSEIKTGADLLLVSGGNQTYQAARLDSGKDLTLNSGGAIAFEGVKDLHQESHEKSNSSLAWTSAKGKGNTDETLRQSELVAKGDVAINAVNGLHIDVKQVNQQTVSQAIDAMVKADPQLAWLKDAEKRGDVDWRQVKEIHDSFKYSQSGLGAGAQLALAIVMAVFVGPAAMSALSGAGTVVAAGGAAVATGAATNAASSFISNKGDLAAVFKDTTSSDALKGYAVSGLTAGFTAGYLDSAFGVKGDDLFKVTHGFNLGTWGGAGQFAAYSAAQGGFQAAAQTAILGGSLGQNLESALTGQAAAFAQAVAFNAVGGSTYGKLPDGSVEKVVLHALVGGLLSQAQGKGFATGAAAAGANEALINQLSGFLNSDPQRLMAASQIVGLLAAAAVDGDVQTGANIAKDATAYNRLPHEEETRWLRQQSAGDEAQQFRLTVAACAVIHCASKFPEGSADSLYYKQIEAIGNSESFADARNLVSTSGLFQYGVTDTVSDALSAYQVGTRLAGGVQMAGGVALAAGGAALSIGTEGAGSFLGVPLFGYGADTSSAGAQMLWNGTPANTLSASALGAVFGVSPESVDNVLSFTTATGELLVLSKSAGAGWSLVKAVDTSGAKATTAAGELAGAPPKNPLLDDSIPRNGDRLVVNQGPVPTCGHNSCGMVLDTLGKEVDIGSLIQRIAPSEGGIYTRDVASLMTSEGVPASAFGSRNVADLARYTGDGTPVVVRIVDNTKGTDFSHFVVVDGVTTRNGISVVAIRDPHGTQYFSPVSTFQRNFSGEVVVPRSALK